MKDAALYVASSDDRIGKKLIDVLSNRGFRGLLNEKEHQPDLRNLANLIEFFKHTQPDFVFVTDGKTGGIQANQERPAELMFDNLQVACNVIHAAKTQGVKRLLYLASSCVYPRLALQPMRPAVLMTGHLEPTNVSYAMSKLMGIELCRAYSQQYGVSFFSAIPANVFGPNDNFNENDSHVIGALVKKMHRARINDAEQVKIWGSGAPRREFIFVDDLVDACVFLMQEYFGEGPINIGTGQIVTIAELAELIKNTVGYEGQLQFESGKPDGMPSKLLDSAELSKLGWRSRVDLETGVRLTYEWYIKQLETNKCAE